jgi:hypothetical protein
MQDGSLPSGVGRKCHRDGAVRPFPGNTIVCHSASASALTERLDRLHEQLRAAKAARLYTLLPPSSWHMTLFDGVANEVRIPDRWPRDIPLDTPLAEVHRLFEERLKAEVFGPKLRFFMRVAAAGRLRNGIDVRLQPGDAAEERAIRALRDRIAAVLRLRRTEHDTYGFHITLAYFIARPGEDEAAELRSLMTEEVQALETSLPPFIVGPPEFCHFNDMFLFNRQFFLR